MLKFVLAALLIAAPALAQTSMSTMPMPVQEQASPASKAFKSAMDRMMADMAKPAPGDTDHEFVAGMLPHHRGAVDMARIELQYGKDPALKRLARAIIKAQDSEIAFMQRWQRHHPLP